MLDKCGVGSLVRHALVRHALVRHAPYPCLYRNTQLILTKTYAIAFLTRSRDSVKTTRFGIVCPPICSVDREVHVCIATVAYCVAVYLIHTYVHTVL